MLIFHAMHLFFTFYELWTTLIVEIFVFYTLGNIYIEAFNVLCTIFVLPLSLLAYFLFLHHFRFPAPICTHLNG